MLIANNKPIALIGYAESTFTQEIQYFVSAEHDYEVFVITPEDFLSLTDKDQYQYCVAFSLDTLLRIDIIATIESLNLDCIRYCHDSVIYCTDDITSMIGRGTVILPRSVFQLHSKIGKHCFISSYCGVGHYSTLSDNVIVQAGCIIAGRVTVHANSVFQFKSSVLPALTVCSNIELGATSTITKDIVVPGLYVGTPARRISNRKKFSL